MGVEELIGAYFDAIRERDVDALRGLFTEDAELVNAAGTWTGPDAIAEFYAGTAFGFADLSPTPGPLLVDRDRVAVEIVLRMDGRDTAVADVFEVRDGRIARLAIYLGPQLG